MTLNEARYIIRMIDAFRQNVLFLDATYEDEKELAVMSKRYKEAGRWQAGQEAALGEFILRVAENGVPGGEYIDSNFEKMQRYQEQRGTPLIERPDTAVSQEAGDNETAHSFRIAMQQALAGDVRPVSELWDDESAVTEGEK